MKVVYDPQTPGDIAHRLVNAIDLATRQEPSTKGSTAGLLTLGAVFFWYIVVAGLMTGGAVGAVFFMPVAICLSILAVRAWRQLRTNHQSALLPEYCRWYVVPETDLDPSARQMWSRADKAAETITGSWVAREQRIDTVRVSNVLPQWLWQIAETLALLSEARAGQRKILPSLDTDAPEIAVVLDRQRHVQDIAAAGIEQKIRRLEALADRVTEADSAIRRVKAMRDLAMLNDSHADLLARVDNSETADAQEAELLTRDLQAVIAQANEAVRQANEAANALVLPGE